MYTDFFGLSAKPFELLPNPRFLFLSKGHKKALSYLRYGLQERAGFTLLTGEVGSGKTTLLRDVVNSVNKSTKLALIFNTKVSGLQLLAMINEEFGLEVEGKDKVTLLRNLNDFLIGEFAEGRHPIVIIDEAQNLTPEALEEVRLLSNLEAENHKLMQIILVGQPELKEIVARPELRQLRQRISVVCHLYPLTREEMAEYIYHRLATVGNRDAVQFSRETFDLIYDFSQGVPRLINLLCDSILLAAFVEETRKISVELVRESIEELSMPEGVSQRSDEGSKSGLAGVQGSTLEHRLHQIEENYMKLNLARAEREAMLERLSSQGSILEYLINQQQKQFSLFEEELKRISAQIERLRQILMSHTNQDVVRLDTKLKS